MNKMKRIYFINIFVFCIVLITNVYLRNVTYIELGAEGSIDSLVVKKQYYQYFDELSIVSFLIIVLSLIYSILYIRHLNKQIITREKTFSKLFNMNGFACIDMSNAQSNQERNILESWNNSVNEIISLNTKRETYFNNMVHDLKMPLQLAKSNIELYDLEYGDNDYVKRVNDQINQLEVEVQRILILEKIKYFEKVNPQRLDLKQYLKDYVEQIKSPMIEVELTYSEDLAIVEIDQVMLTKVLNNLFDNAIKYKSTKLITINLDVDKLTIKNACNSCESYTESYDSERKISERGNGLGTQIIAIYCDLMKIKISSRMENNCYVTKIDLL